MSDAWVFASIEGSGAEDGSGLGRILVKAEGINHAPLLETEFERAIPRLVDAGLIGVDERLDRYWHTHAGHDLYVRAMRGRGLFGWIDGVLPALQQLAEPSARQWVLPAGAFEGAVGGLPRARDKTRRRYRRPQPRPSDHERAP